MEDADLFDDLENNYLLYYSLLTVATIPVFVGCSICAWMGRKFFINN